VFRFFNVYGPLQSADHAYAAVIPAFVRAALREQPLPIYGDGKQTRDFTYVGTVAQVLARAVSNGVTSSDPVNLAFGSRVSLLTLVDRLSLILGRPLEVEHRPQRRGDVRDSQASNDRLHRLFPTVQPVELDEGLRATVQWLGRTDFHEAERSAR
jgi:UDP-glucose 4-epimerase